MQVDRVKSIDVLRTVAIISVIAIHTTPFKSSNESLALFINQISRFAVPFFFVLSGFFWAKKFDDEKDLYEPTVKMAQRVASIFLFWSIIYLLPMNIMDLSSYGVLRWVEQIYTNFLNVMNRPLVAFMEGTKVHLWFLIGLLCSLLISSFFLRFGFKKSLVGVSVCLYMIGLAGKAYSDTAIGFQVDFNFRNGPFFSLIFFVSGYLLQRKRSQENWLRMGVLMTAFGILCHFSELLILQEIWGTTMAQDYVVGTYFFGIGVALIALSNPRWLQFTRLASVGPFVLGIYASHLIFIEILRPLERHFYGDLLWEVSYVVMVFFLSYVLVLVLSKFCFTKRFVT